MEGKDGKTPLRSARIALECVLSLELLFNWKNDLNKYILSISTWRLLNYDISIKSKLDLIKFDYSSYGKRSSIYFP